MTIYLFLCVVLMILARETTGFGLHKNQRTVLATRSPLIIKNPQHHFSATNDKWDVEVPNEFGERIESVKAAVIGVVGGIAALLPYGIVKGIVYRFSATWEFEFDATVLGLALFGITYRYAVRKDNNPNLKQGVVGSFAITKALSCIDVPDSLCTSVPINCGPPFFLFSDSMLLQGVAAFIEAIIAYGGAAYILERCMSSGLLSKFPKDE
jgi:hypothetical protein